MKVTQRGEGRQLDPWIRVTELANDAQSLVGALRVPDFDVDPSAILRQPLE